MNSVQIKYIKEHPLALDDIRATLQNAAGAPPTRAVERLLGCLIASSVVDELGVADILQSVLIKPKNRLDQLAPLLSVVVADAPDADIWAAVLRLRDAAALPTASTPSSSPVQATYDRTPVEYSSSCLEDSANAESIEDELFSEIEDCTFRGVEGFWNKFFNSDIWQGSQKQIFDCFMKELDDEGKWKNFPDVLDQKSVWNWLRSLEDRCLTDAPNKLYMTPNGRPFEETKGQMAILFQPRVSGQAFEYKNVLVVGEQTSTDRESDFKPDFLQLARLVRHVFANQPTRRFVHAFLLCGTKMELWVFDRSGPYSSGIFDIRDEPEKFGRALVGYATMDQAALGLDIFIESQQDSPQVTLDNADTGKDSNKELCIQLTDLLVKRNAIVGRGTTCYKSRNGQVAKFSWASAKRKLEVDQLKQARERGVVGVADVVGHRQITTIAELRAGLRIFERHRHDFETLAGHANHPSSAIFPTSKRKPSDTLSNTPGLKKRRPNLQNDPTTRSSRQLPANTIKQGQDAAVQQWEDRIYSCLVISPAGRIISDFNSVRELLEALRDAIRAHQSLFGVGQILHRDISSNNIIITEPGNQDGFKGMLIDLDLAKGKNSVSSESRQQTGTMQFLALGVLREEDHTYRHDLESFFYVLLWVCARESWGKPQFRGNQNLPPASLL